MGTQGDQNILPTITIVRRYDNIGYYSASVIGDFPEASVRHSILSLSLEREG